MVEHHLAKVDVEGSSPFSRSNFFNMNTHIVSLLKAITYRIIGSLTTFLISYFLTKRAGLSLGIAGIDFFGKIALYYLHDRIWNRIINKKF